MKFLYIITLLVGLCISQDRSVIFNTGSPDSTVGYIIDSTHMVADRIYVQNSYVLEAMVFYMSTTPETDNNVIVSIRDDNNGVPGELVSDLSEWDFELNPLNPSGYNLIVTTDLCIYLDEDSYYWWQIEAADNTTEATWIHSNGVFYQRALSNDAGDTWETGLGPAGAGGVWAEQIYESEEILGDLNYDFVTNILDIVALVNYIIYETGLTNEQAEDADLNHDNEINVVDIVQLVNIVLATPHQNPDFTLEDLNPVSEYYGVNIGPSFFSGQVSCYYFGKQGWSTCRARFGILNDLYQELVDEGITDVKMMGVNGYQYIDDSMSCMICSEECTSSTCDGGPRTLPWTQDQDDGVNCQGENLGLCEADDDDSDVWELWDISLRDFIILDRYGNEFARVNLTYNNPDPTELGECTGNYQKIKDLILAARNR